MNINLYQLLGIYINSEGAIINSVIHSVSSEFCVIFRRNQTLWFATCDFGLQVKIQLRIYLYYFHQFSLQTFNKQNIEFIIHN